MNTYHISYSCYSRRMRILLNEKNSISSGSTILQYMNEPFYIWAAKILDLLYREIEDDYQLIFEGRPEEIEIMSHLAQQYSHCISFEARTPIIAASLQNRMIGLSTIMTEDNIAAKDVISIEAFFAVDSNNASHWGGYIDELEIR
ncbi:MAG: hypothetical protein IJX24_04565, partial [Oscillospiraceae bacterium]|nr:hypothetical protein [Oscillospiraceae bacterium]